MLNRDLIITNLSFASAEEAIRFGGKLLYEKGYVEERYIESVLEREKVYPTGLPTDPVPIAIPHTNSDCVIKSSMCMMILDEPLKFYQMGDLETPVMAKIVMMLAVGSAEGHLEFLSELLTILSEYSLLEQISQTPSADEIYDILLASGDCFKS